MALGSVPHISVSPAPSQEHACEPYSPFDGTMHKDQPDAYRPVHLSPTPASFPKTLSPLRPVDTVTEGTGMQRERFEVLLKASRHRQAAVPARKDTGLLREIALKAHKNKQIERRALFLSKVLAPPSPTATCTPKTPPESPAIFHYSLPSPGLTSPLALFESLDSSDIDGPKESWVEQVDFKLKPTGQKKAPATPVVRVSAASRPLPSLAQISAHIHSRVTTSANSNGSRLPAFLNASKRLSIPPGDRPRLVAGVGRLNMPVRASQPTTTQGPMLPPVTPTSPLTPKLQVTTTMVPRIHVRSPSELTAVNLQSFDSREQRAKNMLSAIRKRQTVSSESARADNATEFDHVKRALTLSKRKSAPSDLTSARLDIWGAAPAPGGF